MGAVRGFVGRRWRVRGRTGAVSLGATSAGVAPAGVVTGPGAAAPTACTCESSGGGVGEWCAGDTLGSCIPRFTPRANDAMASPTVNTPASPWTAPRWSMPRIRGEKSAAVRVTAAATLTSVLSVRTCPSSGILYPCGQRSSTHATSDPTCRSVVLQPCSITTERRHDPVPCRHSSRAVTSDFCVAPAASSAPLRRRAAAGSALPGTLGRSVHPSWGNGAANLGFLDSSVGRDRHAPALGPASPASPAPASRVTGRSAAPPHQPGQ